LDLFPRRNDRIKKEEKDGKGAIHIKIKIQAGSSHGCDRIKSRRTDQNNGR
jgi:hypothetical protein